MSEIFLRKQYLDLLKITLTGYNSINNDFANLRPLKQRSGKKPFKATGYTVLTSVLARWGIVPMKNAKPLPVRREARRNGLDWPLVGDTMIGLKRLENLQYTVETVIADDVPGDLLEAGVWRGGASIFMQAVLVTHGKNERKVWVCDSFQGLPKPEKKYPADKDDKHHTYDVLAVSQDQVRHNFDKYGLLGPNVCFVEGFFESTLPGLAVDQLAILRLDGDMYSSTICILESLYDKVSPNGFVIVDDFNLSNCVRAVSDFREKRQINERIIDIDGSGVYWRKA